MYVLLEGDLYTSGWLMTKRICDSTSVIASTRVVKGDPSKMIMSMDEILTFLGLLRVTLVMPGTCLSPSFPMDFLAFFSLREWTVTEDPAGMLESPSPPAASASSESELLDASSTSAPFLAGGSSGSSSMRGFDMSFVH